jgi:hypothetical protein
MNTNQIKQILREWAKEIAAAEDSHAAVNVKRVPQSHALRSVDSEPPAASSGFADCFEEITRITDADGRWSQESVDYLLWTFSTSVSRLTSEERESVTNRAVDEAIEQFKTEPSRWVVEHMVHGFHETCCGIAFGKIRLISHEAEEMEL